MTTGAEFHQYLVKLALEAWDGTHPEPRGATARARHVLRRDSFRIAITERMAQGAQVFACEIDEARRAQPTDEEAEKAMAHEMELRRAADPDLAVLEGEHGSDCAVFTSPERGECDCRHNAEPDESMDGDHESALESVYGPNDECEDCE